MEVVDRRKCLVVNGKTYEKEELKSKPDLLFQDTGLRTFWEETGDFHIVLYNPDEYEIHARFYKFLKYRGKSEKPTQIYNASTYVDLFSERKDLTQLDLSHWDTQGVISTKNMFFRCSHLVSINLSGWNTGSLVSVTGMFDNCTSLKEINLNGWNTDSIRIYREMFYKCTSLRQVIGENLTLRDDAATAEMYAFCKALKNKPFIRRT